MKKLPKIENLNVFWGSDDYYDDAGWVLSYNTSAQDGREEHIALEENDIDADLLRILESAAKAVDEYGKKRVDVPDVGWGMVSKGKVLSFHENPPRPWVHSPRQGLKAKSQNPGYITQGYNTDFKLLKESLGWISSAKANPQTLERAQKEAILWLQKNNPKWVVEKVQFTDYSTETGGPYKRLPDTHEVTLDLLLRGPKKEVVWVSVPRPPMGYKKSSKVLESLKAKLLR